ncbi:MAG: DUF1080 domain-containing protein [Planctomycetaceae bacterium]|jgi:hypothetical protein|nr:DUF1080 domain-containing protein [Planctomycetaceae bacterium]
MKRNFLLLLFSCTFCTILFTSTIFGQTNSDQVNLFDKANLSEWEFHTNKVGIKVDEVYSFSDDGILSCRGEPFGWLGTKAEYKNFKLSVNYRWPKGVKPTNSGVFIRLNKQPEKTFLPRCVEIQLAPKRAGDLYGFHGMKLPAPKGITKERVSERDGGEIFGYVNGLKKFDDYEKEAGQWNSLDILCYNGFIIIVLNGKIANWVTDAEQTKGKIGFQSEGGQIEFRNAILNILP